MVPVKSAQFRNSIADEKTMPAAKKFFLAGIFFLIGGFAAVVQLHPLDTSSKYSDSEEKRTGISAVPSASPSLLKSNSGKNTGHLPQFPDSNAPYYDKGTGKYVQAYPQPVLLVDESSLPADKIAGKTNEAANKTPQTKQPEQAANQAKKPEPEKTVVQKTVPITQAEFKPLHQFSVLPASAAPATPPKDKPAGGSNADDKAKLKEKPKPVAAGNDDYLPVFDFAENLAPARPKKEAELPENPFPITQQVTLLPAIPAEEKSIQKTVPPYSTENVLFQKLSPLAPPEEGKSTGSEIKADKAPAEVKTNSNEKPLLRLFPLTGLQQWILR
jgi:hypothetical protein